jgi:peptidoglycan hydrolase-like protein with peptidoglycan-binding domain
MDPNQGSSQPSQNGRRLAGRTIVLATAIVVVLVSGTAVAAVRLRDDRDGARPGLAAPATSVPTTTTVPPTTTTVPPTTTTPPTTMPPKPKPKPKPTPKLGSGVQSHSVLVVQRQLLDLGYADLAEATGRFDASTSHAVLAFQKVHGLDRDGVVGKQTWKALRAEPIRPKPRSKARGLHIETDLTRQVTYLVTDGRITGIINASTASGATYSVKGNLRRAVTPTGTFRIERKINAWRKSELGLLYRPAYFVGGYAYHGSYSVPGWPASHGCIRMAIPTMDRMYDKFAVGTAVHIYRT